MGILNVTPDSFYAETRISSEKDLIEKAAKMLEEEAGILDIGGYSSRPGASDITEEEEIKRVVPAIQQLVSHFPGIIISVDTFRSNVAKQAVEAGASIINDISAGELDTKMFETVASLKVPYIAMHMKGTPQNMVHQTQYENLLLEITNYFYNKLFKLHSLGITDIIIDPGFGFSKTREQSLHLLNNLEIFKTIEAPLLVGISRKSLIYKTLNTDSGNALNGTTALNTMAILKGASILRVHDVKEAVEIVKLTSEMQKGLSDNNQA
ncbi:MAG: dihydropteroate synthase [Opitutaceae bacterium]|nr:dihydropteroate synthase [Cytophagales bacterium]